MHILYHLKELRILRKITLYMLNFDNLDAFGVKIRNAAQIAKKHNRTSFVYQLNCQNIDQKYK